MITDPLFYAVAIPAIVLIGISKGGFGGVLGGTAVPLMALAVSPRQAASIVLPLLCLTDLFGVRVYFGKWDAAILRTLIPGALAGVALGALSFGWLDESAVRLLIGAMSLLFVLSRWLMREAPPGAAPPSALAGACMAAVSGFTSFVAHAGGPPVMMYLLPRRLDKVRFLATINVFFLITNAVKLLPYAWLGQFTLPNLLASLTLAPLVPFGVWLGVWLQKRVGTVWFFRLAQGGLFLTGLQLMYQGASGR
ncbi:MAG TPA: hypothetical protein DCW29_09945 [Janthinobacterium sp.]|nr:hypothetical protein [Janthinobacterium sp.]